VDAALWRAAIPETKEGGWVWRCNTHVVPPIDADVSAS
jgi:hypothetical protein